MGDCQNGDLRVRFDGRLKLKFLGSQVTTDAGLVAYRELDEAFGLTQMGADGLRDARLGRNKQHGLVPLLRQSIYSRLAGYEDVNDAERLCVDPAMRHVVGEGESGGEGGGIASEVGRFETEILSQPSNLESLQKSPAPGSTASIRPSRSTRSFSIWIAPSAKPTVGKRGRRTTAISHAPVTTLSFASISSAIWSRSLLRNGNSSQRRDWRAVLEPVVARYRDRIWLVTFGAMRLSRSPISTSTWRRKATSMPSGCRPTTYWSRKFGIC